MAISRPSSSASATRTANSASLRNSRRSVPTGRPPSRSSASSSGFVPPALQIVGMSAATAIRRAERVSRRSRLDDVATSSAGRAQTATPVP
jgi:hypothetical protein